MSTAFYSCRVGAKSDREALTSRGSSWRSVSDHLIHCAIGYVKEDRVMGAGDEDVEIGDDEEF